MTILARRSFLTGLVSLVAAPAIVKADSLMAIRGVSLYPKLFMTVTLDGIDATNNFEEATLAGAIRDYRTIGRRVAVFGQATRIDTIDVPWLGSVKDSMAWYNSKLTEIQPKFSRVNSIQWKEHMPQKSVFERSAEAAAEEQRFAQEIGVRPIPEQLLNGKPFAYSAVLKGVQGVGSRTMNGPSMLPEEWKKLPKPNHG